MVSDSQIASGVFIPNSQFLGPPDPAETHLGTQEASRSRLCDCPLLGVKTSSPPTAHLCQPRPASFPQGPPRRPARVQGRGCFLQGSHPQPGRWPPRSVAGTSYTAPPPRGTSLWARGPLSSSTWEAGPFRSSACRPSHPSPTRGQRKTEGPVS